jgi:hypothetical protein
MHSTTMSMPMPRPDTSVIWVAVENPGAKMRRCACSGDITAASSGVIKPFSMAFFSNRWGSIPPPSSATSMTTELPRWKLLTLILPVFALPMRVRSAGASMP